MTIAIDCRLIGQSGIGTFIENVMHYMVERTDMHFVLVGNRERLEPYALRENCAIVECNYPSFSLKELFCFPTKEVNSCDAFFTPFFNIPLGIRVPIFSMVHDVVFFDVEGICSPIGKLIRRFFIQRALNISKTIFTVSNFSRQRILKHFHTSHSIKVVPNGLSKKLLDYQATHPVVKERSGIVYLGNIKRHKGLLVLWKAYERLLKENPNAPMLTIIGNINFRTKDSEIMETIKANKDKIRLLENASNQEVYNTLSHAACLVSPSLYEGFGIPPLEAMCLGTPVIMSDIPVYKEIYSNFPVTFFKTGNPEDLYYHLQKLPASPINIDKQLLSTYHYQNTAKIIIHELQTINS
jgi:glycosyltransferase involved in cell wall biosynthesis